MHFISLHGTPYERGLQVGTRFNDEVRSIAEKNRLSLSLILETKGLAPLTEARYHQMVQRALPYATEFDPDLVSEVRGIADGAGIAFEDVFALNYFLDFFDMTYPELTTDLIFGCTTLAASNTATANDDVFIGQNYDLRMLYQPGALVMHTEVAPGVSALIFTIAGLVGCAGMNGSGIGIVINNLTPADSRYGVPYTFVLRHALRYSRISEALNAINAAHRASGIHYLMADGEGEIIGLETTAGDCDVLYALDEYLGHSNHYVHPRLSAAYDSPSRPYNGDSFVRWSRVNKLLKRQRGEITRELLMDILKDHCGHSHSICRHPLLGVDELQTGNTIASLLMDLRNLKLWITTGNPCQNPYEEFSLARADDEAVSLAAHAATANPGTVLATPA